MWSRFSNYSPISLIGSSYKIIAKFFAMRLKEVLSLIIFKNQWAFLKARSILDGLLSAGECIANRIRVGIIGVNCKLDMEKAYDHVNWDFLYYFMGHFGFGLK